MGCMPAKPIHIKTADMADLLKQMWFLLTFEMYKQATTCFIGYNHEVRTIGGINM